MTLLRFAVDIQERIFKNQPFKKFISEDKQTLYIEFYECDLPSITYEFNKTGFKELIKILKLQGGSQ